MARLANLEHLDLSCFQIDSAVTDKGLLHLVGLRKMQKMNLRGLSVSKTAAARLRKALPNAEILIDDK